MTRKCLSELQRDMEGYLQNSADWSQTIADEIARQEGLVLTEQHWEVIDLLRDFYQQFEQSPAMRILVKQIGLSFGKEKGNSIYLTQLFPPSPAKIATKIAGLPKPINCL